MIRILLVLLAVAVSGCGPAVRIAEPTRPPATLAEVNEALAEAPRSEVTVWFTDGDYVQGARNVVVSPVDVRFVVDGEPRAVPVARVREITTQPGTMGGAGALVGAAPGLLAVTTVGLSLMANPESIEGPAAIFAPLLLAGGVVVALGGGVIGSLAGSRIPAGTSVRLYRGPVARYLAPPTPAPPD